MLIRTYASACHRRCIRRKLAAIDVEALLIFGKGDSKLRCRLLQRLNVYWLGDRRPVIDSTRPLRSFERNGLTPTWARPICQHHFPGGKAALTRIHGTPL